MALAGPAFLVLFAVAHSLQGDSAQGDLFRQVGRGLLRRQGGGGSAKRLLQYGAVLYAAGLAVGGMLTLALALGNGQEAQERVQGPERARASAWMPVIAGAAVTLLGTGLAVLRTSVLPTWMGWVAVVVGVVAFASPCGFAGFLVTEADIGSVACQRTSHSEPWTEL